jgi:hypothetical protein
LIVDLDSCTKDEMLIERSHHLCNCKDFPYFVYNFKERYSARDPQLFQNESILSFIEDDTQIPELHLRFMRAISEPLTTEIITRSVEDQLRTYDKEVIVRG